jgi:hypothetical protein
VVDAGGGLLGRVVADPARVQLLHQRVPGSFVMSTEQRQHFLEGAIRRGTAPNNPLEVGCGRQDVGQDVARWGPSRVGNLGCRCAFVEEERKIRLSGASEGLAEASLCRGREEMVVAQQPWGHPGEERRPDFSVHCTRHPEEPEEMGEKWCKSH